MQRERITDHIFVFRSSLYAEVTAGLVMTSEGAVLIDTLLYPEETLRIRRYIERGLSSRVHTLIITHFHADHSTGACFFPEAVIVSQKLCAEMLATRGRESLGRMQASAPDFAGVELALPDITFEDEMLLELGGTRLRLRESPGHSPDSITCLVEDEDLLFAADTVMPLPYFVDGSCADLERSLRRLLDAEYENIVQGHGEIILRGEAQDKIESDLHYLSSLQEAVARAMQAGEDDIAAAIPLEACGKSPVLLNGVVTQLHEQNIGALVSEYQAAASARTEDISEDKQGQMTWRQKQLI